MVSGAARIGVMLLDLKTALMVQQAIENMRRLARRRGDGLERHARLVAMTSVHIRDRLAMAAGLKILPVR